MRELSGIPYSGFTVLTFDVIASHNIDRLLSRCEVVQPYRNYKAADS